MSGAGSLSGAEGSARTAAPWVISLPAAFLIGTLLTTWATYLVAWAFRKNAQPLVAANGNKLFGTVNGTGVNDTVGLTAQGTNVVTITGGTGRFADATGTYTETYSSSYVASGTTVTGPVTTTARGQISY